MNRDDPLKRLVEHEVVRELCRRGEARVQPELDENGIAEGPHHGIGDRPHTISAGYVIKRVHCTVNKAEADKGTWTCLENERKRQHAAGSGTGA